MVDLYGPHGPAVGANASFACSQRAQGNCTYSDTVFADAAVAAVAEAGRTGAPLFLFWAPHAPHDPYEAPDAKLAQFPGIAQVPRHFYTAMTSVLDDNVGRLRDALHAAGLWEQTLWVQVIVQFSLAWRQNGCWLLTSPITRECARFPPHLPAVCPPFSPHHLPSFRARTTAAPLARATGAIIGL